MSFEGFPRILYIVQICSNICIYIYANRIKHVQIRLSVCSPAWLTPQDCIPATSWGSPEVAGPIAVVCNWQVNIEGHHALHFKKHLKRNTHMKDPNRLVPPMTGCPLVNELHPQSGWWRTRHRDLLPWWPRKCGRRSRSGTRRKRSQWFSRLQVSPV